MRDEQRLNQMIAAAKQRHKEPRQSKPTEFQGALRRTLGDDLYGVLAPSVAWDESDNQPEARFPIGGSTWRITRRFNAKLDEPEWVLHWFRGTDRGWAQTFFDDPDEVLLAIDKADKAQ
ncbi:MAG TPA: hypothetical protein VGS80_05265 [Ktedonobacterales bacterium]|nr:hypothetical protein [Ktedonobacterales bacterium]